MDETPKWSVEMNVTTQNATVTAEKNNESGSSRARRSAHIGPLVTLEDDPFIHETAYIFGKVFIGKGASVWLYVVMRSEAQEIRIGARTNIQDFVMVHVGSFTPTTVGEDCSIAHHATLHGCTVGDRCLIGINATLMDGVKVGANSIVAGHSILTEGMEFPENSIIAGSPAKLVKVRDNTMANLFNSKLYQLNAANYAKGIERFSPEDVAKLSNFSNSGEKQP
jgi:carbonic anhydrase/acetyltransferase-like protein (isoleucine patch superfamily)